MKSTLSPSLIRTRTCDGLGDTLLGHSLRTLALGAALCSGCDRPDVSDTNGDPAGASAAVDTTTPPPAGVDSIVISTRDKPIIERIDPASVNTDNRGFIVDMNGDGHPDYLILEGQRVLYANGLPNGHFASRVQIAQLDSPMYAYRVDTLPERGILTPSLLLFDFKGNGYVQENRGSRPDGSPILLDPETLTADSDFDF